MLESRIRVILILITALASSAANAPGAEPPDRSNESPRYDRPPRKVIVGTTMTRWYSDYPGLDERLAQMGRLLDQMTEESKSKYGRTPDLALFTEYALTAGKSGKAADVADPLHEATRDALAALARKHHCYLVFGGVLLDDAARGACSNAAVVIDRQGKEVGRYA